MPSPKPRVRIKDGTVTTFTLPLWVRRGGMLVNRDCLAIDDPDSWEMQLIAIGLDPLDFGRQRPPIPKEESQDALLEGD